MIIHLSPPACVAVLSLLLVAPAGCERSGSHTDSTASEAPAVPLQPSSQPASRPGPQLHDWVREPLVDTVERSTGAARIVSAAPNVTEVCCALGLRSALVGRTRYCDYPPGIEEVPAIGALIDVNVEALLALRPDLILVSGTSRAQIERFAGLELWFESVPDADLSDLFAAIRRVGELTGRGRTAERLCREVDADLAAVTERFADVPPTRVLLVTGTLNDPPRPPYVAGPGSFYDDLLTLAGHENVVGGEQAAFAPLSLEFIVRADPEVIIELDPNGKARPDGDADARRAWAKLGPLRAVTSKRVHVLVGTQHYVLGPRVAFTYAALCHAIAGHDYD
jgi:iron complex transport system substrate-binding protein